MRVIAINGMMMMIMTRMKVISVTIKAITITSV